MQVVLFILSLAFSKVSSECSPKNVEIINFPNNPKRSKAFEVGATVEKCPTETAVFHLWELRDETNGRHITQTKAPFFKVDGYLLNLPEVFTAIYVLVCHTSHYNDMRLPYTVPKTFKFTPDDMDINIHGGPEVAYELGPVNRMFQIDAESTSSDKSFRPDENPLEGNEVKWTITPSLPEFTPTNHLKLKIPGSHVMENNTYTFTVTVTRKKIPGYRDTKTATQMVRINAPGAPKIKIKCVRNCNNPIPEETSIFQVVCYENCVPTTYEWYTKPELEKSKTDFGTGFAEFVIEGGACKMGDKVDIVVKDNATVDSYSLVFEQNMSKGVCTIQPKTGKSGLTPFEITCDGFSTANNDLYCNIYQISGEKSVIVNADKARAVNNILLSPGNPAKVVVEVHDGAYEVERVEIEAEVTPLIFRDFNDALKHLQNITYNEDIASANYKIQTVSYILEAVETIHLILDYEKENFHAALAEILIAIDLRDFDSSRQMLSILKKLNDYRSDTDTNTAQLIGKCAVGAALGVYRDHNPPITLKKQLMAEFVELSSKLLKEVPELKAIAETKAEVHDYESYDELLSTKLGIVNDMRELTNSLSIAIGIFGISLLDKTIPDQKPIAFQTDLISFETRKVKKSTLRENQIISLTRDTSNKVIVPKPLLGELQGAFVDYQFGILQKKPFYWHPDAKVINTDIVLFELLQKNIKIRNNQPFEVHLKVKDVPTSVIKGNLTSEDTIVYRIKAQPGSVFIFELKATRENFSVATSPCCCTEEDFKKGAFIGANESRVLKIKAPVDKDIIYFCIKKQGEKLEYEVTFATFSCLYWDLKIKDWNYDRSFCAVKNVLLSKDTPMVCSCSHSSYFAGKIAAPSFSVNLNKKINFKIIKVKNWFVFNFVMSALLIWALIFLLAFVLDRVFLKRNIVCRLDDNVPGDSHLYMLAVFTGAFIDAGTSADVAFQLIGEKSKSRIHVIKCSGVNMLKRNSQDWFVINTPFFLGDLKSIRLWHNSRGTDPHWYCKRIIVQHLKSGTQYCFIVENWFSLFWGTGDIYREIFLQNLNRRKLLFTTDIETQFKDSYLWVSVFLRDSQSNFSSLERVGALCVIFFISMLASAILYGFPTGTPSDSIDTRPNYFISHHDLIIFFASWLISLPFGIVVVLLFRNSAPRIKELK